MAHVQLIGEFEGDVRYMLDDRAHPSDEQIKALYWQHLTAQQAVEMILKEVATKH